MKFVSIVFIALTIVGCGKSEEDKRIAQGQAQLAAMEIETTQKTAIAEALPLIHQLKKPVIEQYVKYQNCKGATIGKSVNWRYIENIKVTEDCKIQTTFKNSAYTPDLNNQTLTLSFTAISDSYQWQCTFSKKYEQKVAFLPSTCQ